MRLLVIGHLIVLSILVVLSHHLSAALVAVSGPWHAGWFVVAVVLNDAGPFSLSLSNQAAALLAGSWLVMVALLAWRHAETRLEQVMWGLVLGGGLSNLLDRVVLGGVRDVLQLGTLALNVPDLAVVVGVGLLVFQAIWCQRPAVVGGPKP